MSRRRAGAAGAGARRHIDVVQRGVRAIRGVGDPQGGARPPARRRTRDTNRPEPTSSRSTTLPGSAPVRPRATAAASRRAVLRRAAARPAAWPAVAMRSAVRQLPLRFSFAAVRQGGATRPGAPAANPAPQSLDSPSGNAYVGVTEPKPAWLGDKLADAGSGRVGAVGDDSRRLGSGTTTTRAAAFDVRLPQVERAGQVLLRRSSLAGSASNAETEPRSTRCGARRA
jgi:hypothetical protein